MAAVMPYASRTSGRNEAALRDAGWGALLTPGSRPCRPSVGMPWCLDNGAWFAHVHGTPWSADGFRALLSEWGAGADFAVVPDVVAGGSASLDLSRAWLPEVLAACRLALIAVQDGMAPADVAPMLGGRVGLFVGGTTDWKLATMPGWGRLARVRRCHLHIGRVNSARRIRLCRMVGADSFDGSGPSRFGVMLGRLQRELDNQQEVLPWTL